LESQCPEGLTVGKVVQEALWGQRAYTGSRRTREVEEGIKRKGRESVKAETELGRRQRQNSGKSLQKVFQGLIMEVWPKTPKSQVVGGSRMQRRSDIHGQGTPVWVPFSPPLL
jgi:hypothetical protein